MRTSNKILLAALVFMIIALVLYDYQLKAAYQKGDYKNPYRNFVTLNYTGFNAIELNASTAVNIMLVKGPFKVIAAPDAIEYLKIRQRNGTLVIDANFKDNYQSGRAAYLLYISCPSLSSFKADARYIASDIAVTDTLAGDDFKWKPTVIKGFTGDSLYIREDHASNILLEYNRIGTLRAITGISKGSASNLCIGPDNQFNNTSLDIRNKSRLWIKEKNGVPLNYRLADSAKVIVNGSVQQDYKKLNQ
ncbi:MAG: hypothetical protein ACXVJD_14145 [Mucilaginibacter sp.]